MVEGLGEHPVTYTRELRSGEIETVIGLAAASKLPGITATIGGQTVEPGETHVVIRATAEGAALLSRLTAHPLTQAAILLAEAAKDRRITTRQAPAHSRNLALRPLNPEDPGRFSRIFGSRASRNEREAVRLLNVHGYLQRGYLEIPNSDLPSPQALIEEAANRLLHPPVSVAPGIS